MSWPSAKKITNHLLSMLIVMVLIAACMFAQTDANTPQGNAGSKKAASAKGKKQSGAKSDEKKTEAQPA
ncbi:MAG: hypothetical protein ACXV5R_08785, partial [Candidatus Angelobacter sp.]